MMWDPNAEFESATLENGLNIHAALWPDRPWECLIFLVHSGANSDLEGKEGVMHFIEHMVSMSQPMTRRQINELAYACGGRLDLGTTACQSTYYNAFLPAKEDVLSRFFDLFGGMLLSSKFGQHMESERTVIINEFWEKFPLPVHFEIENRCNHALYGQRAKPSNFCGMGTPESISNLTTDDLQTQFDAHYAPQNISIIAAGGMPVYKLTRLIAKSEFGRQKPGRRNPLIAPLTDISPPSETRIIFERPEALKDVEKQAAASFSSRCLLPGAISSYAIIAFQALINKILLEEIREKRSWTYAIDCECLSGAGNYLVNVYCNSLALAALDGIHEVVSRCLEEACSDENAFEKIRSNLVLSVPMLDLNAHKVCSGAAGDLIKLHRIVTFREYIEQMERLEFQEVNGISKWLGPNRRWTIVKMP